MTPAPIDVAALRRLLADYDHDAERAVDHLKVLDALLEAAPALLRAVEERDAAQQVIQAACEELGCLMVPDTGPCEQVSVGDGVRRLLAAAKRRNECDVTQPAEPGLSIAETEDWMGKLCEDSEAVADLPKSVAELRALILPHLLDLEALDQLCALAAPNAKLREAASQLGFLTGHEAYCGDRAVVTVRLSPEAVQQWNEAVDALSTAPEVAKADEVAEPANTAEFDGYAEGAKILKGCIAKYSIEQARAVGIALRQWHDKWVGAVDAIGSNAKQMQEKDAEVAELRAKLEASDSVAIAAQKEGVRLLRDLAAARADQRAVAVAFESFVEWAGLRDVDHVAGIEGKDKPMPFFYGCNQMRNLIHLEGCRRIAALTAPAAEPEPSWFEPNDHIKNVCAIRRKSDGYWWECNGEHGAGWNDKRIRQAWTIRAARIEVEKHLHGQDVEIVQLMPEPAPNPSETPNSSPTFDLAAEMAHDIRVAGLTPAQGGDGDAVLREWLSLNKAATPSSEWVDAMAAVVDALSRRALEGK